MRSLQPMLKKYSESRSLHGLIWGQIGGSWGRLEGYIGFEEGIVGFQMASRAIRFEAPSEIVITYKNWQSVCHYQEHNLSSFVWNSILSQFAWSKPYQPDGYSASIWPWFSFFWFLFVVYRFCISFGFGATWRRCKALAKGWGRWSGGNTS